MRLQSSKRFSENSANFHHTRKISSQQSFLGMAKADGIGICKKKTRNNHNITHFNYFLTTMLF